MIQSPQISSSVIRLKLMEAKYGGWGCFLKFPLNKWSPLTFKWIFSKKGSGNVPPAIFLWNIYMLMECRFCLVQKLCQIHVTLQHNPWAYIVITRFHLSQQTSFRSADVVQCQCNAMVQRARKEASDVTSYPGSDWKISWDHGCVSDEIVQNRRTYNKQRYWK